MYAVRQSFHPNKSVCRFLASQRTLIRMEKLDEELISSLCAFLPPALCKERYKGQAGRIGVIGGSLEYTGAPYFAGITALKVGADLSHIFCTKDAATVIKSYSPELIVHPLLDNKDTVKDAVMWLDRLHVLVIGPGLGRNEATFDAVSVLIEACRKLRKPLIFDADGLFLITQKPDLIKNYPAGVVLTPNAVEFSRLFGPKEVEPGLLERFGPNCTVVRKGHDDEIFDNFRRVFCTTGGSGRRCGGQGDLLSGSLATFYCWALNQECKRVKDDLFGITAAYAACKLTRECNKRAFAKHGRSMTASDMISEVGPVFRDIFEIKN